MRKLKVFMFLLLTAFWIAGCAFFPHIVSAFYDVGTIGEAQYERFPTVQLQFQQAMDSPPMAKLALMDHMDGNIEISDSMASMTCDEAEEMASAALQPYIDAGLVEPFETVDVEVRCLFGQTRSNTDLGAVFWSVSMTGDPEDGFFFADLTIDDETGKLLGINCTRIEALAEAEQEEFLKRFADIYFSGLGIGDYGRFATAALKDHYIGDHAQAVRYHFGDAVYGEVNVDLYVYEYGFYIEFPDR